MIWNERHEKFCREYVRDRNATQAYIRAGYTCNRNSAARSASNLLQEPEIKERIDELVRAANEAVSLDTNEILAEALTILRVDPLNYVDEFGVIKPLEEIAADARRAIASIEQDTVGSNGAIVRTKLKFWSKEKAIELLGKHLALFKEVLAVEGLDDIAQRIVDARNKERVVHEIEDVKAIEDKSDEELV